MPSSNGVATSVTVYVANYGANAKVKCALYNASTLALVGTTEEKTISNTGPLTLNFTSSPPVIAGTKYLIVWWSNGVYFAGRYDMGAPNNTGGYEYVPYGTWPSTLALPNYQPAYYSIYCTYTQGDINSNPAQSNFGYGSTGVYNNGDANCMFFGSDIPSSNGVATSITVYVASYGANAKVKCALYNASTLALVGTTEEKTIIKTGPLTLNFTNAPPVKAGTKYLIVWWSNGVYFAGRYDMGAPNNTGGYEYATYGNWPGTLAVPNYQPAYYSVYCTYNLTP
jgi:hypothetical protein